MAALSETDARHLRSAFRIARQAREEGNLPFGCVVADGAGKVVIEQGNLGLVPIRGRDRACGDDRRWPSIPSVHPHRVGGIHLVHERGAVRDVRRRHLLGRDRPSGLRAE